MDDKEISLYNNCYYQDVSNVCDDTIDICSDNDDVVKENCGDGEEKLFVISSRIDDADKLISSLKSNVKVIYYDWESTSLTELAKKIDDEKVLFSSIAFVNHGDEGKFSLNATNETSVDTVGSDLQKYFWQSVSKNVKNDGRIDLLACNLAKNDDGKNLISSLENLTGKNFAASVDITGGIANVGDWLLETDRIDIADEYFVRGGEHLWQGSLLTYPTYPEYYYVNEQQYDYKDFSTSGDAISDEFVSEEDGVTIENGFKLCDATDSSGTIQNSSQTNNGIYNFDLSFDFFKEEYDNYRFEDGFSLNIGNGNSGQVFSINFSPNNVTLSGMNVSSAFILPPEDNEQYLQACIIDEASEDGQLPLTQPDGLGWEKQNVAMSMLNYISKMFSGENYNISASYQVDENDITKGIFRLNVNGFDLFYCNVTGFDIDTDVSCWISAETKNNYEQQSLPENFHNTPGTQYIAPEDFVFCSSSSSDINDENNVNISYESLTCSINRTTDFEGNVDDFDYYCFSAKSGETVILDIDHGDVGENDKYIYWTGHYFTTIYTNEYFAMTVWQVFPDGSVVMHYNDGNDNYDSGSESIQDPFIQIDNITKDCNFFVVVGRDNGNDEGMGFTDGSYDESFEYSNMRHLVNDVGIEKKDDYVLNISRKQSQAIVNSGSEAYVKNLSLDLATLSSAHVAQANPSSINIGSTAIKYFSIEDFGVEDLDEGDNVNFADEYIIDIVETNLCGGVLEYLNDEGQWVQCEEMNITQQDLANNRLRFRSYATDFDLDLDYSAGLHNEINFRVTERADMEHSSDSISQEIRENYGKSAETFVLDINILEFATVNSTTLPVPIYSYDDEFRGDVLRKQIPSDFADSGSFDLSYAGDADNIVYELNIPDGNWTITKKTIVDDKEIFVDLKSTLGPSGWPQFTQSDIDNGLIFVERRSPTQIEEQNLLTAPGSEFPAFDYRVILDNGEILFPRTYMANVLIKSNAPVIISDETFVKESFLGDGYVTTLSRSDFKVDNYFDQDAVDDQEDDFDGNYEFWLSDSGFSYNSDGGYLECYGGYLEINGSKITSLDIPAFTLADLDSGNVKFISNVTNTSFDAPKNVSQLSSVINFRVRDPKDPAVPDYENPYDTYDPYDEINLFSEWKSFELVLRDATTADLPSREAIVISQASAIDVAIEVPSDAPTTLTASMLSSGKNGTSASDICYSISLGQSWQVYKDGAPIFDEYGEPIVDIDDNVISSYSGDVVGFTQQDIDDGLISIKYVGSKGGNQTAFSYIVYDRNDDSYPALPQLFETIINQKVIVSNVFEPAVSFANKIEDSEEVISDFSSAFVRGYKNGFSATFDLDLSLGGGEFSFNLGDEALDDEDHAHAENGLSISFKQQASGSGVITLYNDQNSEDIFYDLDDFINTEGAVKVKIDVERDPIDDKQLMVAIRVADRYVIRRRIDDWNPQDSWQYFIREQFSDSLPESPFTLSNLKIVEYDTEPQQQEFNGGTYAVTAGVDDYKKIFQILLELWNLHNNPEIWCDDDKNPILVEIPDELGNYGDNFNALARYEKEVSVCIDSDIEGIAKMHTDAVNFIYSYVARLKERLQELLTANPALPPEILQLLNSEIFNDMDTAIDDLSQRANTLVGWFNLEIDHIATDGMVFKENLLNAIEVMKDDLLSRDLLVQQSEEHSIYYYSKFNDSNEIFPAQIFDDNVYVVFDVDETREDPPTCEDMLKMALDLWDLFKHPQILKNALGYPLDTTSVLDDEIFVEGYTENNREIPLMNKKLFERLEYIREKMIEFGEQSYAAKFISEINAIMKKTDYTDSLFKSMNTYNANDVSDWYRDDSEYFEGTSFETNLGNFIEILAESISESGNLYVAKGKSLATVAANEYALSGVEILNKSLSILDSESLLTRKAINVFTLLEELCSQQDVYLYENSNNVEITIDMAENFFYKEPSSTESKVVVDDLKYFTQAKNAALANNENYIGISHLKNDVYEEITNIYDETKALLEKNVGNTSQLQKVFDEISPIKEIFDVVFDTSSYDWDNNPSVVANKINEWFPGATAIDNTMTISGENEQITANTVTVGEKIVKIYQESKNNVSQLKDINESKLHLYKEIHKVISLIYGKYSDKAKNVFFDEESGNLISESNNSDVMRAVPGFVLNENFRQDIQNAVTNIAMLNETTKQKVKQATFIYEEFLRSTMDLLRKLRQAIKSVNQKI